MCIPVNWQLVLNHTFFHMYEEHTRASKSTKSKPTIATDPKDFEMENLRIERDTCKLKLTENDNKIKDLKEQLDIYIARCSLLEKKRNDEAYEKLTNTTEPVQPVHQPVLGPRQVPEYAPPSQISSSPSSSALETLVNLEVLKVAKATSTATNPPTDVASIQEQLLRLESRLTSQIEQIKTDMNKLFTNNCLQYPSSVSSQTEAPSSSSEASGTISPLPSLFPFPPPPIKETKNCSSQTVSLTSTRTNVTPVLTRSHNPGSASIRRKSILGSPPQPPSQSVRAPRPVAPSLLGKPPLKPRKIGSIPCLSPEFILAHGRTTSENVKDVRNKKRKPTNQKQTKKGKPQHVKTAVLVDLNIESENIHTDPTHSTLNIKNSGRSSENTFFPDLIDLDSPEVSNKFGDPLNEDTSYFNIIDNLNC